MKKFKYIPAQFSCVSFNQDNVITEVIFHKDNVYELPESNDHVKALVAKKVLLPVDEKTPVTPISSKIKTFDQLKEIEKVPAIPVTSPTEKGDAVAEQASKKEDKK